MAITHFFNLFTDVPFRNQKIVILFAVRVGHVNFVDIAMILRFCNFVKNFKLDFRVVHIPVIGTPPRKIEPSPNQPRKEPATGTLLKTTLVSFGGNL